MRSLLSALRQTGVLGAHPTPPGALLPARRVPSGGLGPWDASRAAREPFPSPTSTADSFDRRRRRQRRLPLPAPAAAAVDSSSSAGEEAKIVPFSVASSDRIRERFGSASRLVNRRLALEKKTSKTAKTPPPPTPPPPPPPPPADVEFGDPSDQGVLANASGLQLLFLGTGAGPSPSASRGAPCVAVRTNHASWLFDCGDDTQRALSRQRGAAPAVRHGRIAAFFVTSRHGGGALGLPGMLCIASAARDVSRSTATAGGVGQRSPKSRSDAFQPPQPASVSIFGPPGIASFLDEMLTLSDTYLSMPVLVHEFGLGGDDAGDGGVAPSSRGAGAVPIARQLSRRAKLSVATLLPDSLNPFGFYDLEPPPRGSSDADGGDRGSARRGRRPGRRNHGNVEFGFGDGVDARSGVRGPSCLPPPVSPEEAEANVRELREDPSKATWTLRFDNEYVVKCVPLVAGKGKGKKKETSGGGAKSADGALFSSGPDALAYVIRESARAGKIDAAKAESLGVRPGPMMAELKAGKAVTVLVDGDGDGDDGDGDESVDVGERGKRLVTRVIQPEEVVAPDVPGRVVAVLGDPLPPRSDAESLFFSGGGGGGEGDSNDAALVALSSALVREARDADLVVAGASSAAAAAEAAERAGAAALVLTRFGVARGSGGGGEESGGDGEESDVGGDARRRSSSDTAAEAAAVIAAREAAGPRLRERIAAARDLDLIVLSRRGGGGGANKEKKKGKRS